MKILKYLFLVSISAVFLGSMAIAGPALAQEDVIKAVKDQEVTLKDLEVSDPGMLPGNPFYFLKQWSREVKDTLTSNSLKKAELQLSVVNEMAAEIKKIKELPSLNFKILTKALDSYGKNLDLLKQRVESLDNSVYGHESDIFLNQLSDLIIKHVKLFSETKEGVDDKNKKKLSDFQEKAMEIIASIPSRIETPSEFKCRLEKVIKGQNDGVLKEITIAEVLDRLDEKMSKEAKLELLKIKENILIKFQSRLQSEDFSQALSEIMIQIPGDLVRKIKILDEIREGVSDNDIKNKLNLVRQDVLEKARESKEIRKPEAQKMIDEAAGLLKDLQSSMSSTSTPKSAIISSLFMKAKFNLEQAEQTLSLDNYSQAFGQASVSAAAARAGLNYISKFNLDSNPCAEEDVKSLKEYYDEIISNMKEMGLDKNNLPALRDLLEKSEKSIAKISDLVKKNAKADTLIPLLKDSKLMLSQIDNILAEILNSKKAE